MAKITIVVCDVKPCNRTAEREFELNGEKVYVCGESCFVKYWSREYHAWKSNPYVLQMFQDQSAQLPFRACEKAAEPVGDRVLQVLKPV